MKTPNSTLERVLERATSELKHTVRPRSAFLWHPDMRPIRLYLDSLFENGDLPSLQRIVNAPIEDWIFGCMEDASGKRCLIGHSEDWHNGQPLNDRMRDRVRNEAILCFDTFADLCGLRTVVTGIKEYILDKGALSISTGT
jgi:hypothetical protein